MGILRIIAICLLASASSGAASSAAPSPSALHLKTCTVGKSKLPAHCGILRVYENRATRTGRMINLHFVEVDAERPSHRGIFFNPGGPGGDDLSMMPYIVDGLFLKEMRTLHSTYNLVFIDNRGTGKSHAMQCDLFPARDPAPYYLQLWPEKQLRACRARLAKTTDLSMYTTDISAADLDEIRAALHYPKIVLDGGSYGTMFYLDYARRYPSHVESLVLRDVAPPGISTIPLPFAKGAQKAMTDLITDCSHDTTCHRSFPYFAGHFEALLHRFDRGPIPVRIINAATKKYQNVQLSKEVFTDRLRDMLYSYDSAAYVPYILEQFYDGNDVPLGRMIEIMTDGFGRGQNIGLNLSVTCAEDIPFITDQEIERTSTGTFQGDTRVRAQQRACQIWNVHTASPDFATPVRSTAPILMMSSAEDPATPPQYGHAALRYLPNARQIVIPFASHEDAIDCADDLIVQFIRTHTANRLGPTQCTTTTHRPPFETSMKTFPT